MKHIKLETQMRAGTHYLASSLAQACIGRVTRIKEGKFEYFSDKELSLGLYEKVVLTDTNNECIIYQYHYYHDVSGIDFKNQALTLYLIGFPFDSFYSDGLVFSKDQYNVGPSSKNQTGENYQLKYKSPEWNFLEPYMKKNAEWLEWLSTKNDSCIIRYEDLYLNFEETVSRIEKHVGPFSRDFHPPVKNTNRMYWTDEYQMAIDKEAFFRLKEIFSSSLARFYPEKNAMKY